MTFRVTIAAPFKHTRKTAMRKNELVYYYALDRKWMSTEQANLLLHRAEDEQLLRQENGVFSPLFDISEITVPVGFKPTSAIFDCHDPLAELISRIARAKKTEETEVVAEMNRLIREQFDNNLLPAAALVLIAKTSRVAFEDLTVGLRASLQKK